MWFFLPRPPYFFLWLGAVPSWCRVCCTLVCFFCMILIERFKPVYFPTWGLLYCWPSPEVFSSSVRLTSKSAPLMVSATKYGMNTSCCCQGPSARWFLHNIIATTTIIIIYLFGQIFLCSQANLGYPMFSGLNLHFATLEHLIQATTSFPAEIKPHWKCRFLQEPFLAFPIQGWSLLLWTPPLAALIPFFDMYTVKSVWSISGEKHWVAGTEGLLFCAHPLTFFPRYIFPMIIFSYYYFFSHPKVLFT